MEPLFDEEGADKTVIASLLKELEHKRTVIQSLTDQLKRSQNEMFIKSTDGKFYRVEADQEVSADEVQAKLSECQSEVASLQALVETKPSIDTPTEQPAASADGSAPADAPADTTTPPADPNAAPAADPSAAQPEQTTQPDPSAVPPLQ